MVELGGTAAAVALEQHIDDPHERIDWRVDIAEALANPAEQREVLVAAAESARSVPYAVGSAFALVVRGAARLGFFDEAGAWLEEIPDEEEREQTASYVSERRELWPADPELKPRRFGEEDAERRYGVDQPAAEGKWVEAIAGVREDFPTRVCASVLAAPDRLLVELLLFQVDAVLSYHRNDLKLEYMVELWSACRARGVEVTPLESLRLALAGVPRTWGGGAGGRRGDADGAQLSGNRDGRPAKRDLPRPRSDVAR